MKQFWSTFFLVLVSAALVGLGYHLGGWPGAVMGFGVAFLVNLVVYAVVFLGHRLSGVYDVREPREAEELAFVATLARYAAKARLALPSVLMIDTDQPNVIATGHSKASRAIGLGTAIFQDLKAEERSAIAAHLIARYRNRDLAGRAWITSIAGFFMEMIGNMPWEAGAGIAVIVGFVLVMVVAFAITFLAQFAEALIFRRREYRTDRRAAVMCGQKAALIDALQSVGDRIASTRWPAKKDYGVFAQLFFVNPNRVPGWLSSQPTVAERIAALRRSRKTA